MITELGAVKNIITKSRLNLSEESIVSKQDMNLLGYILSRYYLTKQWELVNLSHCEIDDEKFEVLHEILTKDDRRPKPEIKDLQLSGNKLSSCSDAIVNLAFCLKIVHLDLSYNVLKDTDPFRGDFLKTLDVSNNNLDVMKVFTAVKFLRNLEVLKLNHNKFEYYVEKAIGLALCSCNLLKELQLDGNNIEFEVKVKLLFQVINEIRSSKTDIHDYSRVSDKASAFIRILCYCDELDYQPDSCVVRNKIIKSKEVNISHNGLVTFDGWLLGQHLHLLVNLKKLNISKNKISDKATESLSTGILFTPNLKEFTFNVNLFGGKSITIFNLIQQLRTNCNKKTFKCTPSESYALVYILTHVDKLNGDMLWSNDVVSTLSQISELNLCYPGVGKKLTSEYLNKLCPSLKWFKQLEVLDVTNNNITDEAMESIVLVMLQMCTLKNVRISGNPLSKNKFNVITFDTIASLHEMQKQLIACNSHLECQSLLYIMKCLDNPKCALLDSSAKLIIDDPTLRLYIINTNAYKITVSDF